MFENMEFSVTKALISIEMPKECSFVLLPNRRGICQGSSDLHWSIS